MQHFIKFLHILFNPVLQKDAFHQNFLSQAAALQVSNRYRTNFNRIGFDRENFRESSNFFLQRKNNAMKNFAEKILLKSAALEIFFADEELHLEN